MKVNYTFSDTTGELKVTVQVDKSILGVEAAIEINDFWAGANEVMAASKNDPWQAVARWAAARFISMLMQGKGISECNRQLMASEGWYEGCGVKLIAHDTMDLHPEPDDLALVEERVA